MQQILKKKNSVPVPISAERGPAQSKLDYLSFYRSFHLVALDNGMLARSHEISNVLAIKKSFHNQSNGGCTKSYLDLMNQF